MRNEILDINNTGLDSMILGFEEKNISAEKVIFMKIPNKTDLMINPSRKRRRKAVSPNAGFCHIFETTTSLTTASMRWESFSQNLTDLNFELPVITTDICSSQVEQINIKSIASKLLLKIETIEEQGKTQESIKEVHKLFENLLSMWSIDIANQVLQQCINKDFSLSIFVAFLSSTFPFKNDLPNRSLVFDKAEAIAISEIGKEKLSKSIFNNLK